MAIAVMACMRQRMNLHHLQARKGRQPRKRLPSLSQCLMGLPAALTKPPPRGPLGGIPLELLLLDRSYPENSASYSAIALALSLPKRKPVVQLRFVRIRRDCLSHFLLLALAFLVFPFDISLGLFMNTLGERLLLQGIELNGSYL